MSCSSNCSECESTTSCTTCTLPWTLTDTGVCKCEGGYIDYNGDCYICEDDTQYFDGLECQDCGEWCSSCSTPTGDCITCQNNLVALDDGSCGCNLGYYNQDNLGTCVEATAECDTGYYNDGEDNCQVCKDNCAECEAYTAVCTLCQDGFVANGYDNTVCGDCAAEVGPVDSPVICLTERYSDERAVPPYSSTDTAIDWRDWYVVERMMD